MGGAELAVTDNAFGRRFDIPVLLGIAEDRGRGEKKETADERRWIGWEDCRLWNGLCISQAE